MSAIERLSITLPAEMARHVRASVEAGHYASISEVIRDALRSWQEQERVQAERLAAVRARLAESLADPRPSLDAEQVRGHFKARAEAAERARRGRDKG